MIPKLIHYSWFSGDPYPSRIEQCMASWKLLLPDYEFVLWDLAKTREIDNTFLKEALQERKWAFAADVVRCYAIYKYGGIWLDTDVEIFQSFDSLLDNQLFIGKEGRALFNIADSFRYIYPLTAHCFGAEAGHPFMGSCYDYYHDRHFITSLNTSLSDSLRYDLKLLPEIMSVIAASNYGYDGALDKEDKVEALDNGIVVYPYFYFDLPRYHSKADVFAIHYLQGGWVNGSSVSSAIRGFRKKDLQYYIYHLLNSFLKRRRLKINLQSY